MSSPVPALGEYLDRVYDELGYREGELLSATETPSDLSLDAWVGKGSWLEQACIAGADKLFFVRGAPVIVFAKSETVDEHSLRQLYNKVWCLARPKLLFLELPGLLEVYDLSRPPAMPGERVHNPSRLVKLLRHVDDVAGELADYHRRELESVRLPAEYHFGGSGTSADETLVHDLSYARESLMANGLPARDARTLICQSLFVRYLEDRHILTQEYFQEVASARPAWERLINEGGGDVFEDEDMQNLLYPRVLLDVEFTKAFFGRLAKDLNGDMFPDDPLPEAVSLDHLRRLRGLLIGASDEQLRLFFRAYKFDVIPIELISSIYEEFYNAEMRPGPSHRSTKSGSKHKDGTHYTPNALVEFILEQALPPERLEQRPKVLDPACGSGVFLIEAFRRMVRYRTHGCKRPLRWDELRDILKHQIVGIDVNEDAIGIAAFSLYLAYLHYQEPRSILGHRLPRLVYRSGDTPAENSLGILLRRNSFPGDQTDHEWDDGPEVLADVIVGNPPWGTPDLKIRRNRDLWGPVERWCALERREVGDKELSQAFIHRALSLLKPHGVAALLVSSGVLFKSENPSRMFRQQWLTEAKLLRVVNFSHVRSAFFCRGKKETGAAAPFVSVLFQKECEAGAGEHRFDYWSAKRNGAIIDLDSIAISRADLRVLSQRNACVNDDVWKIYWWGTHHDEAFVRRLQSYPSVSDALGEARPHYGMVVGTTGRDKEGPPERVLPADYFTRYGEIPEGLLCDPPRQVRRVGSPELYSGTRLLFKRGAFKEGLVARLETNPYAFTHDIYGLKVDGNISLDLAKVILGICWSSTATYYLWMTCGSWGTWHDAVHAKDMLQIPAVLPEHPRQRSELIETVDELRHMPWRIGSSKIGALEERLNNLVLDLFEASQEERDLVANAVGYGLDLYAHGRRSLAAQPVVLPEGCRYGVAEEVVDVRPETISGYLATLTAFWNSQVPKGVTFRWQVLAPSSSTLVCVILSSQYSCDPLPAPSMSEEAALADVLRGLSKSSRTPFYSRSIYMEGMVRVVTENDIVIIKSNERRLWTASAAREDAEATLLQAISHQGLQHEPTQHSDC